MARISSYAQDSSVTKNDKVLGTDSSGSVTRNFTIESISDFLSNTNAIGIANQINFEFVLTNRTQQSISFENLSGNNTAFNAVSSIVVSDLDAEGNNIGNLISQFNGKTIILARLDDFSNFGIFKITNVQNHASESNFKTITLTNTVNNGSFIQNKYYGINLFPTEDDVSSSSITNAGGVLGSGTSNKISKFSNSNTLANSTITDDGSTISTGSSFVVGSTLPFSNTKFSLKDSSSSNQSASFSIKNAADTTTFLVRSDGLTSITGNLTVTGAVTANGITLTGDQDLSAYATLASPAFTGTPTAPTASTSTNSTQIATTAYVTTAVSNLIDSAPGALNTLNELAAALGDDANFSTTVTNNIAGKLPLTGGTLTGNLKISDDEQLRIGSGNDLKIFHQSSSNETFIQSFTKPIIFNTFDDILFKSDDDLGGTTEYFSINSANFNVSFNKDILLVDNVKINFGSSSDLQIYHDGSNSYINETGTGSLLVQSSALFLRQGGTNNTNNAIVALNGAVSLYHNNSVKLTTASTGVSVTGTASIIRASSGATRSDLAQELVLEHPFNVGMSLLGADGRIAFGDAADNDIGLIRYLHSDNTMTFTTNASEAVRIDSSGNVGIGTTSPGTNLHVSGSSGNTMIKLEKTGTNSGQTTFSVENQGRLRIVSDDRVQILTDGSERMRVLSSGDVAINRTSALGTAKLSIQTDAGEDAIGIQANSNNTTTKVLNVFNSSGVDIASLTVNNDSTPDMLFNVDDGSGTITEVLKLDSSQNAIFAGNVGINVTNPDKRLKVNGQTQFYEYSGAHLTNNAHSTYNFDTLVTNSSATNGGGIGAYVKLAAGATNNSLGDFNAIRTRAYAENTTVNVNSLINFYAEFRNFTSTNSVTLGNHYGLKVDTLGVGGNATVTNNYGVYLNPGTAATNNYGVFQVGASVKNRFNGKVGIGEDPAVSLHVVSSDEVVAKFKSSDNKAVIEISDDDTTGYVSAENGRISIGPQQGLNVQNLNILTSNYKVGVGTATPGRALHAYHATENEVLRLESGDPGAYIQFKDNNSDFQPAIGAIGNNLQFRASGSQIAKFDIDGNLRLGSDTGTIRARLHLSGSSAADAGIRQSRDGVKIWTQEIDNNGKLQWAYRATEAGSATQHFTLNDTGQAILHQYGSGNFTGTAAFNLQLDSSGNLIETAAGGSGTVDGSGSGSRVAIWSDADSITSDSGFTFDGTELLVEDTIVIQRAGVTAGSSSFQQTGTGLILNAPSGYHPLVIKHAGSELFRFKNDGRLGIGTTTPDHQLHIEFANTDTTFSGGGNGAWGSEGIRIENTSGTANTMAMLQFRNSDADIHIAGIRRGTDDSDLGFFFEGDEKVRFTNDGLVGIGTTDPIFTLDVRGDIGTDRYIRHNGDSNTYFGFSGADTIQFNTAGGERMRIASNGNVGIGTTSPGAKMHVVQSAVNTQAVRVDDGTSFVSFVPSLGSGGYTGISNAGDIGLIFSIDGDNTTDTTNGLLIAPHTQTSGGLKILENGNVGIGVATPGARLQVNGSTSDTSANAFIARNSSGTSLFSVRNDGRVDVPSGAIVHAGGGYANTSTNDSYFTGDLGIGTTAPAHKLDISSTGTAMARIISSDGGTARFDLHSSGNSRYSLSALASNGFLLFDEVESDTAVRYFGGSSGKWIFRTNNLERFNIESDGQIKLNTYGTATHTGTATKTLQVDSSGNIIEGSIVNFAPKVEYQTVAANIAANTTITLPNSLTYTISSGGYEYLEVFIDGIRLMRDIDFEEISTSSIKLLMAVPASSVFTFKSIT